MEKLTALLQHNIEELDRRFESDSTFIKRSIKLKISKTSPALECVVCFGDGMVNSQVVNESVIRPILRFEPYGIVKDPLALLECRIIESCEVKQCEDFDEIEHALVYGDTILLCEGVQTALIIGTKGFDRRAITEPISETVLKGPREGFTEPLLINITLIKRRVRTSSLKFEYFQVGQKTKTKACLCYIDGVADEGVLNELKRRLKKVKIDGVFNSNALAEFTQDSWRSPFSLMGTTERPDTVAANILEGRIAIIVDGTPVVITVPHLLIEHFQTSEDYSVSNQYATAARILRVLGIVISISIAPLYIALVTLHRELLPLPLLFSITAARQGVPMPTVIEAVVMILTFNLLRESGARSPSGIGQTLSIVGAIVLGQAAVEARFVSAPMVIIVAFSGISGLMLPKLTNAVILIRAFLLVLSAVFGLYGYIGGMIVVLLHTLSLKSFGVEFTSNSFLSSRGSHEDSMSRVPFFRLKKSGRFIARREDKA